MTQTSYFSIDLFRKTAGYAKDPDFSRWESIEKRRYRKNIPGFRPNRLSFGLSFVAGDIIFFTFERGPVSFFFEGICLSIRKRGFGRRQMSIIVRNFISGVGVETNIAYYLRRLYRLGFSDYKRKQFFYHSPRLYYLRGRINKETRVLPF